MCVSVCVEGSRSWDGVTDWSSILSEDQAWVLAETGRDSWPFRISKKNKYGAPQETPFGSSY